MCFWEVRSLALPPVVITSPTLSDYQRIAEVLTVPSIVAVICCTGGELFMANWETFVNISARNKTRLTLPHLDSIPKVTGGDPGSCNNEEMARNHDYNQKIPQFYDTISMVP